MESHVNNVDLDQTPHNVASDLGLHCWPMALLRGGGVPVTMGWQKNPFPKKGVYLQKQKQ